METFNFPNHTPTHVYPKGDAFQFGRGYEHSVAPQEPLQRRFTLHFNALIWYKAGNGLYNETIDPENNALAFDSFYRRHRTHKKFIYPHLVYGLMFCKFASDVPFEMPKSLEGGHGVTDGFTVTLVEQPL